MILRQLIPQIREQRREGEGGGWQECRARGCRARSSFHGVQTRTLADFEPTGSMHQQQRRGNVGVLRLFPAHTFHNTLLEDNADTLRKAEIANGKDQLFYSKISCNRCFLISGVIPGEARKWFFLWVTCILADLLIRRRPMVGKYFCFLISYI